MRNSAALPSLILHGSEFLYQQYLLFAVTVLEKSGPQVLVNESQAKKLKQIPYHRSHIVHGSLVLMGMEGMQKTSGIKTEECKKVIGT